MAATLSSPQQPEGEQWRYVPSNINYKNTRSTNAYKGKISRLQNTAANTLTANLAVPSTVLGAGAMIVTEGLRPCTTLRPLA